MESGGLYQPPDHSPRRARQSPLDRIGRIVVAWRRRMARYDQAIDQRLVLGGEAVVERADVIVPLFFGTGTGDDRADERGGQPPGHRPLYGRDAPGLRSPADFR